LLLFFKKEDLPMTSIAEILQFAAGAHQAGSFQQAEAAYRHVLAAEPDHPQALHLLGVLFHQTGRSGPAEQLIRRSLALAPNSAEIHNNFGKLLRDTQRPQEAAASFRNASRLKPRLAEIHHNLGLALNDLGDRKGAEAAYRRALALQSAAVAARIDLATLLCATERGAEAEACLAVALAAEPANPRVHNALAMALAMQAKHADALQHCEAAIANAPGFYLEAHFNRANALISQDRLDEAEAAFRGILALVPNDEPSLIGMIQLLAKLERGDESEPFVRTLLTIKPNDAELHFTLAGLLSRADRKEAALDSIETALRLDPDYAKALHAKWIYLCDLGRFDESATYIERAAAMAPEDADIQSSLSYGYLMRRDYARGWPQFEWRIRKPGNARLPEPFWDGAPTDRLVMIHAEQGVGDNLQFCRFLHEAARRARVAVAGPVSCRRLFEKIPGIETVFTEPPLPPYDLQCPMMSLAHVLGVEEQDFASHVPYLQSDDEAIANWRKRLAGLPGLRVGLVWAGNPKYPADRKRSMHLSRLEPLRSVPGISFISLQKGDPSAQLGELGWHEMLDQTEQLADFADTAALLEALDLVIAVDTGVAHLAGALARPVWLLNRIDTDWRWQLSREDSPWYPTMRIFRQTSPGDWAGVVARVREALVRQLGLS
jgi:Flp pilus assembly protein TadD